MSEENPQTPAPEDKSSSVPLKKETTRVTLKASEGAAPPPPAPAAPAPAAPAQATQPLKPAAAPSQPSAAKTVPLDPAPADSGPATQSTVKLQPSAPGSAITPGGIAAPLSTGKLSASLDDDGEESFVIPLAWGCFVFALALLVVEAISSPSLVQQTKEDVITGAKSWGIPHDDYDRSFNPSKKENKPDDEALENGQAKTVKFTRTDATGETAPMNTFNLERGLPIRKYEEYTVDQN